MLDITSLLLQHLKSLPEDTTFFIKAHPYNVGYLIGCIESNNKFSDTILNNIIGEAINNLTVDRTEPYSDDHYHLSEIGAKSDDILTIANVLRLQISRLSSLSYRRSESITNRTYRHNAVKVLVNRLYALVNGHDQA